MEQLEPVRKSILDGDLNGARAAVQEALDAGIAAETILKDGLIPAMFRVGELYEAGEYYVPEMLVAARAMKSGLELLKPQLVDAAVAPSGIVIIGTVKGDLHDIGKNLVGMMLEGAGFEVVDLGTDVSADQFAEAIQTNQPDIVALSALLTTTMPQQVTVIDRLKQVGLREHVKIIVGGAPVTEDYAREIGADGYAPDAGSAATLAKELLS